MTPCETTITPELSEIDIPALRERYRRERDKRLRKEGQSQYIEPVGAFASAYESDPHMRVKPRAALSIDIDAAILGAGFCGMLAAIEMKKAGVTNFMNIDWAGDWGGCWYWNRYPGIQCDNDAYCYMPLLEETGYMPKKKFEDGWDIYQHSVRIAKQFGLYRARDLSHAGHCAALGREDQSLAADHESRRRHSRSLRRHGRRSVEQAEVARRSGHE